MLIKQQMLLKRSGYVLALAMGFVALVSVLVTGLVHRVIVFHRVQYALVDREQARLLALSGVNIAIAQITDAQKAGEKKKDEKQNQAQQKQQKQQAPVPQAAPGAKQPQGQPQQAQAGVSIKDQLTKLTVVINRWQTFSLPKEAGVEGSCEIYIASERGKIDLNSIYDFSQRKFVKRDGFDGEKICQLVGEKLSSVVKSGSFAELLTTFLKERGYPLTDISQLVADKRFEKLRDRLFVTPNGGLALYDLFTVETQQAQIQPWFITSGVGQVLGFKVGKMLDAKIWQKSIEKLPASVGTLIWQQQWDTLVAPVYGKEYAKLTNEVKSMFAQKFESAPFSVVSYGKFGAFTTRVYAIIEEKKSEQGSATGFGIRKLYWF